MLDFAKQYHRFLRWNSLLSYIRPVWLSFETAAMFATIFSPIKCNEAKAMQTMSAYLGDKADTKAIWQGHLKQHGVFSLNVFKLKHLTKAWCDKQIKIIQPEVFKQFCENKDGGVVLTFHVHHQHYLCSVLGLYGHSINPLAVPPEGSSLYDEIKDYIDLLHNNSSQHFGKGSYIFLEPEKMNMRKVYRILLDKQIVVSLNDNSADDLNAEEVTLFDKPFKVSPGVVRVAKKYHLPIWAALVCWDKKDNFSLEIELLDNEKPVNEIMQDYMNFFQTVLTKKPELWEGWQW